MMVALGSTEVEVILRAAVMGAVPGLQGGVLIGQGESHNKDDGTQATELDRAIEQGLLQFLQFKLAQSTIALVAEEGGRVRDYDRRRLTIFVDPQDGTASGRHGATTVTAGASLYDPNRRKFLAGAVVDPFGGRLWYTVDGVTWLQRFNVYTLQPIGGASRCRVSSKGFIDGGEPLIEVAHGFTRTNAFTRNKRAVLSDSQVSQLWHDIQLVCGTKIRGFGSNLYHQALVAKGGDSVATIMTAIGGPWDMSGLPLVLGAGGVVLYLEISNHSARVIDDPMAADMVICANNLATAQVLVAVVDTVCKQR